jgi:aspartate racemase
MKTIGILGGMSPESTTLYYEHITRTYTAQHGGYGYPEILIYSVSFQKFVDWQRNGQWHEAAQEMAGALERLRLAGADFGLIATNTMHFVFDEVQQAVRMPLLSIVNACAPGARRELSSDAPKSRCCCSHSIATCPCSIQHCCTPRRRWPSRFSRRNEKHA